jgi:pimeloyl-ACP methyl ester carboxylesterase
MEKVAKFKCEERELVGIVNLPDGRLADREKVGVILSVPALKYRISSFRLNVKLARRLCQEGFHVLRFDPLGIGDSEGEVRASLGLKHFLEIQTGKYEKETKAAIDFFKATYELDKIVLLGLCGGAITVLITGAHDHRVDRLVLLGIPVLLQNIPEHILEYKDIITTSEFAGQVLSTYKNKLVSPKAWGRLFTFKSEYKTLIKSLSLYLKKFFNNNDSRKHPRFNNLLLSCFEDFLARGKKILFINGELDPATWEFKAEFEDKYLRNKNNLDNSYEIHIIKKANHIFSLTECQLELSEKVSSWLRKEYAGQKMSILNGGKK